MPQRLKGPRFPNIISVPLFIEENEGAHGGVALRQDEPDVPSGRLLTSVAVALTISESQKCFDEEIS